METTTEKLPLGRRQSHRFDLSIGAVVHAAGRSVRGRLVNLSREGALFQSKQRRCYFPGPCVLQVALGSAPARRVYIPIDVVRAEAGRFGLQWKPNLTGDGTPDLQFLVKLDSDRSKWFRQR